MKNEDKKDMANNEMLAEYDFTRKQGVRGKYYKAYRQGHTVKIYNEDGTVKIIRTPKADLSKMSFPQIWDETKTIRGKLSDDLAQERYSR